MTSTDNGDDDRDSSFDGTLGFALMLEEVKRANRELGRRDAHAEAFDQQAKQDDTEKGEEVEKAYCDGLLAELHREVQELRGQVKKGAEAAAKKDAAVTALQCQVDGLTAQLAQQLMGKEGVCIYYHGSF
jgi:SMC interacting uncharacterized protein involved in chromosome segregation